jgi:hypothetical protein
LKRHEREGREGPPEGNGEARFIWENGLFAQA